MLSQVIISALAASWLLVLLVEKTSISGIVKALISLATAGIFSFIWFPVEQMFVIIPAVAFLSLIMVELSTKLTAYRQAVVQRVGRQDL